MRSITDCVPLGGISRARQLCDFGVAVGWQMHVEDLGGTILCDAAAMHLAWSMRESNHLAFWLSHAHLVDDYCPGEGARAVNGRVQPSDTAGGGITPPSEWLGEPFAVYRNH